MNIRIALLGLGLGVALVACGPSVSSQTDGGTGADAYDGTCSDGAQRCTGTSLQVCNNNSWTTQQECPQACTPGFGCTACEVGTGSCNGDTSTVCRADGSGYDEVFCDPVQGVSCNPNSGMCEGACAPQALGKSYIGCDYYPTVTGNMVWGDRFQFAVVISNTSNQPSGITIDGGGLTSPITLAVQPQSVAVQPLPWHDGLKLCTGGTSLGCGDPVTAAILATKGAYHLRSTYPVTVYQFSPLDYTNGTDFSYTNDASLLLPSNVWTGSYVVAAWTQLDANPTAMTTWPGLMAVTAREDNTMVTITTRADVPAGTGTQAFTAGVPQAVTLNAGDTIELTAPGTFGVTPLADLTGSFVDADKPVQVISGHYCAYVPDSNFGYCDHMEQSMFPIDTLSDKYIVTTPIMPALPNGKERMIRIVATTGNTTLTYDPPVAGAATTITNPGDFVEIPRYTGDFMVTADHKVLVVQYMEGQTAGGNTGDPAMTLAVATEQYRDNYMFHAPTNYETNYVDITAPTGTTVMLDGTAVTGWQTLGSTGFDVAKVQLDNGGDGNHMATGDNPFGITVYGFGQYTSFWYPGGLNLDVIPVD